MSQVVDDALLRQLNTTLGQMTTRASVAASNLANVDTPGYRALQASFPDALKAAQRLEISRTDAQHIGPDATAGRPKIRLEEAAATKSRMDGNTVDVDGEMTTLALLQGRYHAATQMVKKRFALLRYAISEK